MTPGAHVTLSDPRPRNSISLPKVLLHGLIGSIICIWYGNDLIEEGLWRIVLLAAAVGTLGVILYHVWHAVPLTALQGHGGSRRTPRGGVRAL